MISQNSYLNNKFIIIYPFSIINSDNNKCEGLRFRNIFIKPYIPNYEGFRKPRFINNFLFSLLNNFIYETKTLIGFSYSIHRYTGTELEKEKEIIRIKNNLEILYYLFTQSNTYINTSFPKFYLIENIHSFSNKDFDYSFNLRKELGVEQHIILSKKRKDPVFIELKSDDFLTSPLFSDSLIQLQKFSISNSLHKGIFWINKSRDDERTVIERTIYSVFALENILHITKRERERSGISDSKYFANKIINNIPDINYYKKDMINNVRIILKDSYEIRNDIVHGNDNVYESVTSSRYLGRKNDIRVNIDGYRFSYKYQVLDYFFDIILRCKVKANSYEIGLRFENLLKKYYPNKEIINRVYTLISKKKLTSDIDGFIGLGMELKELKKGDIQGISSEKLSTIIIFINSFNKILESKNINLAKIDIISNLRKKQDSWLQLIKIIDVIKSEKRKWKNGILVSRDKLELSLGISGVCRFIELVSDYIRFSNIH